MPITGTVEQHPVVIPGVVEALPAIGGAVVSGSVLVGGGVGSRPSVTGSVAVPSLVGGGGTDTGMWFFVDSINGSDLNSGNSWSAAFQTLQAGVDGLPSSGGTVYVAPGTYAPISTSKANVNIIGLGAPGQDEQVGAGSVVISVPSGQYGAAFSVGAGSENYRGPRLKNLYFKGVTGSLAGVQIGRASNFLLEDITCANFLDGTGILLTGSSSTQYGEIHSPKIQDCLVGLDVVDINGVRLFGGSFEYYLGGAATVTANTIGIRVGSSSDSFRAFGPVVQYYETCIYLAGSEAHEIHGGRFEAFSIGIRNASSRSAVYGGSYNNSILGGSSGLAFQADAASDRFVFFSTSLASMATPAFTDAGTNTHYLMDRWLQLPSSAVFAIGDARLIRNTTGQMEVLDNFNTNLNMTIGRIDDSDGDNELLFGSSQTAGIAKMAPGVVGISTGTCLRTGTAATAGRPLAADVGEGSQFFDATLNIPIWSDGTNWRNAAGTIV